MKASITKKKKKNFICYYVFHTELNKNLKILNEFSSSYLFVLELHTSVYFIPNYTKIQKYYINSVLICILTIKSGSHPLIYQNDVILNKFCKTKILKIHQLTK